MSALEEMLREMSGTSSSGKRGFSEDVEVIKKYLDAPKLVGLEHGDVLEVVEGYEGRPGYGLTGKNVVFDRYLTQTERELFMASVGDGGARDADICIASSVGGSIPLFHFVDSRAFRKVSQE